MRARRLLPAAAAAVAALLAPRPASAAPDILGVHADGYVGYSKLSAAGSGLLLGVDAAARLGVLQLGALAETTSTSGSESAQAYGGMLGLAFYDWAPHLGIDLVGVGGLHVYEHVGNPDLTTVGASGVAPFVEARGGLNFLRLRPLSFGFWVYVGDDVTRSEKTYPVDNRAPGGTTTEESVTLGESFWGVAFRLGLDLGI